VQIIIGGGDDGFNIGGPEHRESVILSLALGHHRHPMAPPPRIDRKKIKLVVR